MELSELTDHAREKFHILEEHKWADLPHLSVLTDPHTGRWVAFLMRQWDTDTGTEIQRCDIKCGSPGILEMSEPYLTKPFRMKGEKWVGVIFDESTRQDVVFRLFDQAVYREESQGFTVELDYAPFEQKIVHPQRPSPAGRQPAIESPGIPDKIRKMKRLYEYKPISAEQRWKNFCRQGKFMEDYEDNLPWTGSYRHYFPTYHDLNLRQLRGYFTWRARLRKGEYTPIATSLAYIYLYELINGIGTDSPRDSLKKMREFEEGFLDAGFGDEGMRQNLRRWMLEYAILQNLPAEEARVYADPVAMETDHAFEVLRKPKKATDDEIVSALCLLAGDKFGQSPVVRPEEERGRRLFAEAWRYMSKSYTEGKKSFFAICFGRRRDFLWYPLANAVYWERERPDTVYALNLCRTYCYSDGFWMEIRYDPLYFNKKTFRAFLHETERCLRKYLKIGRSLQKKPEEAWITPYVEAVLAADRQREAEAARPRIQIDPSRLERIRQDALSTRDSLLIEEETEIEEEETAKEQIDGLEEPYSGILWDLLRGDPVEEYIKEQRLMPSIVADRINEALMDEVGDNVIEWDGKTLSVVEDYREDILRMFGGENR